MNHTDTYPRENVEGMPIAMIAAFVLGVLLYGLACFMLGRDSMKQ